GVELGNEVAQEIGGAVVCDLAIIGNQARRELDISLWRVHLRRIAEAEHTAEILLRDGGADRARRGADHRRRLAGEGVGAIGTARPVDGILQSAGYGTIIFGR